MTTETIAKEEIKETVKPEKTKSDPSSRKPEFYNIWRRIFLFLVTHIGYMTVYKIMYRLEVHGRENIPKDNEYIVASNHLSTLDPPLICGIMDKGVAYMAKKELFNHPLLNWWLNWLGAFAVDREKLSFATVKTVMTIKKTGWVLGIFPQGTRQEAGVISNVTKGFATIAKKTKCGILPIGIVGTDKKAKIPFTGKIIVRIGKLIPYRDDVQEMVEEWGKSIAELTGFEYVSDKSAE